MPRTFKISLLSGAHTHVAHPATLDLAGLISGLTRYQARASKDGGAWSPVTWGTCTDEDCEHDAPHSARAKTSALGVSALAFDIDHASPEEMCALGAALERLGWVWILHESYTAGRYRLIIPLAADIAPADYPSSWESARSALGVEVDSSCRDLGRLFYLPARPPGETREADSGGQTLLDPATLKRVSAQAPAPSSARVLTLANSPDSPPPEVPKFLDLDALRGAVANLKSDVRRPLLAAIDFRLRLPKGERETPLHVLTSNLTTVMPQQDMGEAWEVVKLLFGHVIDMMPDPTLEPAEYLAKVRSSFERAWDLRENRNAQRAEVKKFFEPEPQAEESWRSRLIPLLDKDGDPCGVKACTANLDLILEHDPHFKGHIKFNDLRRRVEVTGGPLMAPKGSGTTALAFSNWLQTSEYELHVERMTCGASILHTAKRHHFNPVEDYLNALVWDGKPRAARVLLDLCGADGNTRYIEDITRKFFISAAARALSPGCKVDTVLVLQGIQGTRKTSFVETLAGSWYTTVGNKIIDKDTQMQATEAWFVELSELASVSKSTLHSLRGYLTKRVDQIRVPYAESHEDYDRRCVFVGTTNEDQPLIDPDGNRRYWVVACGEVNIAALAAERDQIWAEAVHLFRLHEQEKAAGVPERDMQYRWWLTRAEQDISDMENEVFQQENPIEDDIKLWLTSPKKKPEFVTATQIAKLALHITTERMTENPGIAQLVGKTLINMGWARVRKGTDPKRYWAFKVPEVET